MTRRKKKEGFLFNLDSLIHKDFKEACAILGVNMSETVEDLMKKFIGNNLEALREAQKTKKRYLGTKSDLYMEV